MEHPLFRGGGTAPPTKGIYYIIRGKLLIFQAYNRLTLNTLKCAIMSDGTLWYFIKYHIVYIKHN